MARLSAAQKKRRRKAKSQGGGVAREANDNKKDKKNNSADQLALEVRAKMTGLPIELCRDQRAGTFIGVLAIQGGRKRSDGITMTQYDALKNAATLREEYSRALSSPDSLAKRTGGMTGDADTESFASWSRAIESRYKEMQAAIQEAQFSNPRGNLHSALQYCVYQNEPHPHMLGDLRLLANALDHFFKGN